MLDFIKEYSKFEFVRVNDDLFLDLIDEDVRTFHGRIGVMKLKVSTTDDMTNYVDLELNTSELVRKLTVCITSSDEEDVWDIVILHNSITYYMKFSDIYESFSTMVDKIYNQNTYYIETVEGDIRVVKGTTENTFKITPTDQDLKFIDPVVIRTEEKDSGTPKFNFSNELLKLDIDPFLEDSFIVDTVNGKDYDHLIIGDKDGKDRLVIFKEDDIITQDYHEKVIVFQYYNTDAPDDIYNLKLKTIEDFQNVIIERYNDTLNMSKLTINMSKSTLDESIGSCIIVITFESDGAITGITKNIDNTKDTPFDGDSWSVINYMYYINKIDGVEENNEILIPTETVSLTINLSALVFGYPIRKVIASFGNNNLEIVRRELDGMDSDFSINMIPFRLPYSETEDMLSDGSDSRVYYCAGNMLMNTNYSLSEPDTNLKDTYHVDKIREIVVNSTDQYIFHFEGQPNAILGQIQYDIMNFRKKSKPTAIVGIYQVNHIPLNMVSLDITGRSNLPIGNNYEFIFNDGAVGIGDKSISDDLGFTVEDYYNEALTAVSTKPIYETVIAAAKIACASSESFGVLYILADGYLYWTIDETTSVKITKVYNKDTILHYGWHKTIECGQVLVTYNNADIASYDLSDITDTTVGDLLDKFEQYSMVIDQGNNAVLIRELITRDFQRDSLKMLFAMFYNMTISPAGVFSDVSIDPAGGFFIDCTMMKHSDNAYTNTHMLNCVVTGPDGEFKPINASGMLQNSNFVSSVNGSMISIVGGSISLAQNMLKGSTINCNILTIGFSCMNKKGEFSELVRLPLSVCHCCDGATITATTYVISFNNYSELDLSGFYANSNISNLTNNSLSLKININENIDEYYPIVKMSSFLENAKLNTSGDGKLSLDFNTLFSSNKYRIGECDGMFTNLKNDSEDVILKTHGGNIKFQAASTDFNPRDIFGLTRPKKIRWIVKTLDKNGNVIRVHSH